VTKDVKENQARQQNLTLITGRVLRGLGRPPDLQRVQVRHLWEGCYRVNIFTGLDFVSSRMAHSYFLMTNDKGAILTSTPPLVRLYEQSGENDTAVHTYESH
jgi:hypothetical protein